MLLCTRREPFPNPSPAPSISIRAFCLYWEYYRKTFFLNVKNIKTISYWLLIRVLKVPKMRSLLVRSKLFSNQSNKLILLKNLSSIQIGAKAKLSRTFTAEDVNGFAKLSGDTNPLHLDENYCSKTKFGKCIVHGALVNGYFTHSSTSYICQLIRLRIKL